MPCVDVASSNRSATMRGPRTPLLPATRFFFALALASAAAVHGCGASGGAGVFGAAFPDNHGAHLRLVVGRLEASRHRALAARRERRLVLAVTQAPTRLLVFDLDAGAVRWESPAELRSAPHLAGDHVVTHEGSEIVVRDARTGHITSRLPDRSLNLVGAAGEGEDAVVVLSTGGGVGAFSVVRGLRRGAPSFGVEVEQAVGQPAVAAGMAFLPWAHQNLSVLDLASGEEIARVRSQGGVVASALAADDGVFFGQSQMAVFGAETEPVFVGMARSMPGSPQLLRDAYQPPQGPNSAQNRVRLVFRPVADGGRAAFAGGAVYLVFYRLVFALENGGQTARWVTQLPRDVIGAQAVDGGLLVADEGGAMHCLAAADGRETWSASLPATLVYATFAADGLTGGAPRSEPTPLRDQLLAVAQNTDARLVPLRQLAVRLLAEVPEPEATASLVALCDEQTTTPAVREAACEALAERRVGSEHVLSALERHAAFLRGTRAPPVGPLARAAVAMGERRAVPLLVAHLRDPETAASDIAPLAQALAAFGDASAAPPLADFLRLYHAEAPDAGLEAGLAAAMAAYRMLLGPSARELLEEIADDALASDSVRAAARAEIAALTAPTDASDATSPGARPGTSGGPDMVITEADDPRPPELTASMVREILEPRRRELEQCLITPGRVFAHARVVVVVDPSGEVRMVTTSPPAVLGCVEPIVRAAQYPLTRARSRQQVTYEIRR